MFRCRPLTPLHSILEVFGRIEWAMTTQMKNVPVDSERVSGTGVSLNAWRDAEQKLGRVLAEASAALARLDERIAVHSKRDALIARLALSEVCDLSWADGADIPLERLALYRATGTGGGEAGARSLLRADWAIRRLAYVEADLTNQDALIAFLGLKLNDKADDALMDLIDRALGPFFVHELETWLTILHNGKDLHPLTQAAIGYQFWRFLELARGTDLIEPAVIASKLAAGESKALPFVPLAIRNRRALQNLGIHPEQRLQAYFTRVTAACAAARYELIQLDLWQRRAVEAISGMSGKTPARLVDALITHPVVSGKMLAEEGEVSLASAQRALAKFEDLGLTKEVTGGGRFRYWRAI